MGVYRVVRSASHRQTKIPVKGLLRTEVDTPVLEIGSEFLQCPLVLRVELVQNIVCDVKRANVLLGLYDQFLAFLDGEGQQAAAHEVHQPVRVYTLAVLRKKLRVFLDERNNIVFLLSGRL